MTKLKNPLLSFDATGSLGNAVSYTHRRGVSVAEKRPLLPYFLTLPVQYQRWLYQDYAYLWKQQSAATKQIFASSGVRHHLTGFQYWMKHQLTYLPDIIGMWYLDERTGFWTYDKGREGLDGVIFGATPATGRIGGGYLFDGLNDRIGLGQDARLRPTDVFSIEAFIWPEEIASNTQDGVYSAMDAGKYVFKFGLQAGGTIALNLRKDQVTEATATKAGTPAQQWSHIAGTFNTVQAKCYLNGVAGVTKAVGWECQDVASNVYIGLNAVSARYFEGIIDHVILRNRVLDSTEIKRHAERRYP